MIDDIQELLSREPFRQFPIVTSLEEEYVVNSPKQFMIPHHGDTVHSASRDNTTHGHRGSPPYSAH